MRLPLQRRQALTGCSSTEHLDISLTNSWDLSLIAEQTNTVEVHRTGRGSPWRCSTSLPNTSTPSNWASSYRLLPASRICSMKILWRPMGTCSGSSAKEISVLWNWHSPSTSTPMEVGSTTSLPPTRSRTFAKRLDPTSKGSLSLTTASTLRPVSRPSRRGIAMRSVSENYTLRILIWRNGFWMDGSWTTNWTSPRFTPIKRRERLRDTPIILSTNRNDI